MGNEMRRKREGMCMVAIVSDYGSRFDKWHEKRRAYAASLFPSFPFHFMACVRRDV